MTKYQLEELSIELANRCLMKCTHCSSGSSPKSFDNELQPDEVMRLITEARALGATVLSLSGGDPILVDPTLLAEYINCAVGLGYDRVLLYTTGIHDVQTFTYHNDVGDMSGNDAFLNVFSDLLQVDRLTFIFSLHSHQAAVHDYIMGVQGAWRSIVRNIAFCIDAGFNVEVHTVPMLPNWQGLWGLRAMLEDMGVSKMSLLRFVPQTRGRTNNRQLALNASEFLSLQGMIDNMLTFNTDTFKIRAGCPMDFRHTLQDGVTEKPHPCHAGMDLILVRPRGDVHPCAAWKSLPETDNVRTKSLAEIWEHGEVFNAIRTYQESGWNEIQGVCSSCKFQESCKSGCPAQRMHALKMVSRSDMPASISDLYVHAADPLCIFAHRSV